MFWLLFSVLASVFTAVSNIIDKFIVSKLVKNPIVSVIFLIVIGLISGIVIYIFHGVSYLSLPNILLSFIIGIAYVIQAVLYFKAIKIEEISKVMILFNLVPIFTLTFATIFLGEIFAPLTYLGIFLLVIGATLISSKKSIGISSGKAFWYIILATILISMTTVIIKYLLRFTDFWTIFSYEKIGMIFTLIPIIYFGFPDLVSSIKKHGKKVIGFITLSEFIALVGMLFFTIATSLGYVSLVNAVSSIQPFFVLLFAIILSIFYPRILKEEIEKKTIVLKILAIVLMFIGILLIT